MKDYDMNVHYHPGKANVVADALSRMSMGSTTNIEDKNKEMVNDVHSLTSLCISFTDSFFPSSRWEVLPMLILLKASATTLLLPRW